MGNPAGVKRDFEGLERRRLEAFALLKRGVHQAEVARQVDVFDFILGTHPISTKGTSEIGGAKRRSDFEFYTEPPWFFNPDFFSASFSL